MIDKLKVFRGCDYPINSMISIHQPTLGEICDYGEKEYFSMIHSICATPADRKVDIWDQLGIYWEKVDEYELFISCFAALKNIDMSIIFTDLDVKSFEAAVNPNTQEIVLRNKDGVVIDRSIHALLTDALREIHKFKKNVDCGYNDETRDTMIEDDRDEMMLSARKPYESMLLLPISVLTNIQGFKYRHDDVWSLPIGAFMDALERNQKNMNYSHLMQGIYSGCIDMKKIPKKELSLFGS